MAYPTEQQKITESLMKEAELHGYYGSINIYGDAFNIYNDKRELAMAYENGKLRQAKKKLF